MRFAKSVNTDQGVSDIDRGLSWYSYSDISRVCEYLRRPRLYLLEL